MATYWWKNTNGDNDGSVLANYNTQENGGGSAPASITSTDRLYFSDTASSANCSVTAAMTCFNVFGYASETSSATDYTGIFRVDVSLSCNHLLMAGSINLTSSTVTVSGDIKCGGTWTFGTSEVILTGTGTQTIGQGSDNSFYKLTTNKGTTVLTLAANVAVTNTFTCTASGAFNGYTLYLYGNLVLDDDTVGGTTTIEIAGNNIQTITGTGGGLPAGNIVVNKGAGVISMGLDLVLGASQNMTITAGVFDMNNNDLTVRTLAVNGTSFFYAGYGGTLTIGADLTVASGATFDEESGSIVFADVGNHTITMSPASGIAFHNVAFGASSTHTFTSGKTLTVKGVMTSNGAKGATASLIRASTATSAFTLHLDGTCSLGNKVDVMDCDGSAGAVTPIRAIGSVNNGNTPGWLFKGCGLRGTPRGVLKNVFSGV